MYGLQHFYWLNVLVKRLNSAFFLLFFFLISQNCKGQAVISTFLGDGSSGAALPNVSASNAKLSYPNSISFDDQDNMYIVDSHNGVIRKYDQKSKIISIVAGAPITASLYLPHSIAFDKDSNMFISDRGRHCIYKKDKISNQLILIAGFPNIPSSQRLDAGDGGLAINARLHEPCGLAFDSKGDLYIADKYSTSSIRKIDMKTGIINTVAGESINLFRDNVDANQTSITFPTSIVFDKEDNYFFTELNFVRRVDAKTNIITTIAGKRQNGQEGDSLKATEAKLNSPYGLALDPLGNVYLSEMSTGIIRKIDTKGMITRIAGNGQKGYSGDGRSALLATMNEPYGIALDKSGAIYVAEWKNHVIRKIVICNPVNITGPSVVCNNQPVRFFSESFTGTWQLLNTSIGEIDSTGLMKPYKIGMTDIVYNVSSKECGISTDTLRVNIFALPKPDFSLPIVCLPSGSGVFLDNTKMEDNSSNTIRHTWMMKDRNIENTATTQNFTYKFADTGTYNIKLIATTKEGCSDSITKSFSNIYLQPKAQIKQQHISTCINQTFQFSHGIVEANAGPIKWDWWTSANDKSVSEVFTKKFSDSGAVRIYLSYTDKNGCKSDTASTDITIYPYPIIKHDTILLVDEGVLTKITPFYYGKNLNYLWSPSTYLNNIISASPIMQAMDNIKYRIVVTGEGNCISEAVINVKVLKTIFIPNAFSPNGDGINDEWTIRNLDKYPGARVSVFNRNGNIVFSSLGYHTKWDGTYNNNPVPVGTYYYLVEPMNQKAPISGSLLIIK